MDPKKVERKFEVKNNRQNLPMISKSASSIIVCVNVLSRTGFYPCTASPILAAVHKLYKYQVCTVFEVQSKDRFERENIFFNLSFGVQGSIGYSGVKFKRSLSCHF